MVVASRSFKVDRGRLIGSCYLVLGIPGQAHTMVYSFVEMRYIIDKHEFITLNGCP